MPILSHQSLLKAVRGVSPIVTGESSIQDEQIQMASIDLTLGDHVYGIRASALPQDGMPIEALIRDLSHYHFELDGSDKLLLPGQIYLVPLNESVRLPHDFTALFSPKSSIGRVDVFVRVLGDRRPSFDELEGYKGRLYLEITPLSFGINVRKGQALTQMRIRTGEKKLLSAPELALLQADVGIVWEKNGTPYAPDSIRTRGGGIFMHMDLDRNVVGFKARARALGELSLSNVGAYDPDRFWEPIHRPASEFIVIEPGTFYLLATRERVRIPKHVCGEMAAYDVSAGEFRTHYAGFFDPGFGGAGDGACGTVGVMEVRGRELPFCLFNKQPVCRMDFELLDRVPDLLYGSGNNYTGAGPSLSKFFRNREAVWCA